MAKFTITGKHLGLMLIAFAVIWMAAPSIFNSARGSVDLQTDTSPIASPLQEGGEVRNIEASPAQVQSPLVTPGIQPNTEQTATPVPPSPTPDLPTSTETPTALPTPSFTATSTEAAPEPSPTEVPSDTPVPLPTATQVPPPTVESTETTSEITPGETTDVYPPEDGGVSQKNNDSGWTQSNSGTVQTALQAGGLANGVTLGGLFSLETMILALLCLIFMSINGLGIAALIVTMLYIRSRRDEIQP